MLGIPTDVVDATEHLLRLTDEWQPRRVDIARVNERHFLFSAGVGLDASVVERVDAHPRLKARMGEWYYTATALRVFTRRYLLNPPRLEASIGEPTRRGRHARSSRTRRPTRSSATVPSTSARARRSTAAPCRASVLERASPIDVPDDRLAGAVRSARSSSATAGCHAFSGSRALEIRSLDERPLPLQVDGDYIGEVGEAAFGIRPGGLLVVA